MRRIALQTLFHDRSKLAVALAGVIFAAVLVFTQLGLLKGYATSFVTIIDIVGGDVWVISHGAETLEWAEPLSVGSAAVAGGHACVEKVRPLIFKPGELRKPDGALQQVLIVAADPGPGRHLPWAMTRGNPLDLAAPLRVTVDTIDREKLQLPPDPVGTLVEIGGLTAVVAGTSTGIRSGATMPFVFADPASARRLARLPDGSVTAWLLDLEDPACAPAVIAQIDRHPGLQAMTGADASARGQRYWLKTTGIGSALIFVAVLGLIVGTVIVGQTLFSLVRERERELATLRALGFSSKELAGFVAWQAGLLCVFGIGGGTWISMIICEQASTSRLMMVLAPRTVASGAALLVLMCVVASIVGVRRVMKLDPAIVFA